MSRLDDVVRLYALLGDLSRRIQGTRRLANCTGRSGWPAKGVYFFFEEGETRTTSGTGLRVVRVGTHALTAKARATLWQRLSTHQGVVGGSSAGGGNHRGSVFRLHVGAALLVRDGQTHTTWAAGSSATRDVRRAEHPHECRVSERVRSMPFLWLDVSGGADGGCSVRARIEANAIALLSNWHRLGAASAIDPPSSMWLGRHSPNPKVRESGLWNVRQVDAEYDPQFLPELRSLIEAC